MSFLRESLLPFVPIALFVLYAQNAPTRSRVSSSAAGVESSTGPASTIDASAAQTTKPTVAAEGVQTTTAPTTASRLLTQHLGLGGDPDATRSGLIVTLPDPIASRFSLTFDDQLGALQRAIEASGYSLDRFEFPWTRQTGQRASIVASAGTPGVMLYRSREANRPLLFIWIVGETPTTGIDKPAFAAALEQWEQVIGPLDRHATVPVLGPSFSGSASSLSIAIHNWRRPAKASSHRDRSTPRFNIISGSATAIPASAGTKPARYEIAEMPFHATVPRDADAMRAFTGYLCRMGVNIDSVALLTEANTSYGQEAGAFATICEQEPGSKRKRKLPNFPFPLHVAQLRRHYAETDKEQADARRRSSKSHLTLDAGAATIDVVAPYDQADATAEVQLTSSLRAIADAHARYVGIFASDVRDTIVLARAVREHVPNATLFTLNNELLYLHGGVNPELIGMLVITPYPLVPSNRELTFPFSPEAGPPAPATDRAVGIYNAALALLDRTELLSEYAQPLADTPSRPAHWLTMIGRGRSWPLQAMTGRPADSYLYEAPRSGPREPGHVTVGLPHVYYPLFCGWCIGALLLLYAMGGTRRGFDGRTGRLRLLAGHPGFARYFYVLTALVVIAAIHALGTVILLLPFLAGYRQNLALESHLSPGVWVAVLAALGLAAIVAVVLPVAIAFAVRRLWVLRAQARRSPLTFILLGIGAVSAAAMSILLATRWLGLDTVDQILLAARASSLASGVSPLTPLVCVAAAALCASSAGLRRLALVHEALAASSHGASFAGLDEGEAEVQRTFSREMADIPGFIYLVVLLVVPCMGLFLTDFAPPNEISSFQHFFAIGFVTVYLALTMEAARFVYGWWAFRGHLRRLAWHPTGDEFVTIKKVVPEPPAVQLTGTSQEMTALVFLANYAQRFLSAIRHAPADARVSPLLAALEITKVEALLGQAQQELRGAATSDALHHPLDAIDGRRNAGKLLGEVCRQAAAIAPLAPREATKRDGPARAACALLKARTVVVIHQTIRQLQSVVSFVTLGLLLMLAAVSVYPFQPRGWLLSFNWFVMGSTVAAVLVVFVQMDRDRILSELTATTPGRLSFDRDFWLRLFFFILVPLFSLLGLQFPEGYSQIFNLLGAPKAL